MQNDRPRVGLGVMVFKEGKVLLGKRKSSHGEGQYCCPGGHMELGESFVECAQREVREEVGVEIQNVRFLRLMNFKDHLPKHYVDIGMIADWKSGEPLLLEPEKCEGWDWYDPEKLPHPLFGTIPTYFEALETSRNFFDS